MFYADIFVILCNREWYKIVTAEVLRFKQIVHEK